MNLAALWDLPLCFFIENNGYAVATTLAEETRETRLSSRGLAYGIPACASTAWTRSPCAWRRAWRSTRMRVGQGAGDHRGRGLPLLPPWRRAAGQRLRLPEQGRGSGVARARPDRALAARDDRAPLAHRGRERRAPRARRAGGDARRGGPAHRAGRRQAPHRPVLWPRPEFRDEGLRGDLAEFAGARFEELRDATGASSARSSSSTPSPQVMGRAHGDRTSASSCLGEDIHRLKGGTNGATRGLAARFPDRIVPTPIAEQGFVGLAGGVAMEGTLPAGRRVHVPGLLAGRGRPGLQPDRQGAPHVRRRDARCRWSLRTKCAHRHRLRLAAFDGPGRAVRDVARAGASSRRRRRSTTSA